MNQEATGFIHVVFHGINVNIDHLFYNDFPGVFWVGIKLISVLSDEVCHELRHIFERLSDDVLGQPISFKQLTSSTRLKPVDSSCETAMPCRENVLCGIDISVMN